MTIVKFNNRNRFGFPFMEASEGLPEIFAGLNNMLRGREAINRLPSVNIIEHSDAFQIDLAVPGLDKKDFTIKVEDGILAVSGEQKEEKQEDDQKVTRHEFHYGSFKRCFTLPDSADSENINASYIDGILSLKVAKKAELKAKPVRQIIVS